MVVLVRYVWFGSFGLIDLIGRFGLVGLFRLFGSVNLVWFGGVSFVGLVWVGRFGRVCSVW